MGYTNVIHAMEIYNKTSELLDDIAMGMLMPDGIDEEQLFRVKSEAENVVLCSMGSMEMEE